MKKLGYIIAGICVLFTCFIIYRIVRANPDTEIPRQQNGEAVNNIPFDMSLYLKKIPGKDADYQFLTAVYLGSCDLSNAAIFREQLNAMDSLTGDERFNRRTLSEVLTTGLAMRDKDRWSVYAPDSLLLLLQRIEPFQYYAAMDARNRVFYHAIYSYWMNFIAGKLTAFSEEKPSRKYDFKFQYLLSRCKEQSFTTSVKVSSWEKFIENLINSNWGHLLNATWNQASGWLKTGMTVFLFIFAYGVFQIFQQTLRHLKPGK